MWNEKNNNYKFETISITVDCLKQKFNIIDIINVDEYDSLLIDLYVRLQKIHKDKYLTQERIVFVITKDFYKNNQSGIMLHSIQNMLNDIDISNFFVCIVTTNPDADQEYQHLLQNVSIDKVPLNLFVCDGIFDRCVVTTQTVFIKYQSPKNNLDEIDNLTTENKNWLFNSEVFCMAPWTSLMVASNGTVKPCASSKEIVGNCNSQSLEEIWNSSGMMSLRKNMMVGEKTSSCKQCYDIELLGRASLRKSLNNQLVKRSYKINHTHPHGKLDDFSLNYVDIRFNNLCNLVCRTCGIQSSSSWHRPAIALKLVNKSSPALIAAGRHNNDLMDQIIQHADHLDQIYFAGGEPMMIEEFYQLLDMLDSRSKNHIKLLYNTNLTRTTLKQRSIFNAWKNFPNISIGASLDGEHQRGEYIRIGTKWQDILTNRQQILDQRPDIDFYISPTVSILNVLHLPDFHRSWVEQGFIRPDQFDISILFNPLHFRIDTAPKFLKDQIKKKYHAHLEWLQPKDSLGRAMYGFQSVLNYIENDRSFDKENFWKEIKTLDNIYNLNFDDVFPELSELPRNNND